MGILFLLFLILSLIAEILGTIGGFGSSVFFVPFANLFIDFKSVLGVTAIFHLSSNISKLYLFRDGFNKQLLAQIGIPAVVFVIIGGFLSKYIDEVVLQTSFSIFIIITSLFFLIFKHFVVPPNKQNAMIGGTLSGFLAGVLGTGGAVRGITMVAFNIEKSAFVATSAAIDFAVDFSRTIVYIYNGYVQQAHAKYIIGLLIIGFVGSWIGKRLLQVIPQNKFRMVVLLMLLAVGLFSLINTINNHNAI